MSWPGSTPSSPRVADGPAATTDGVEGRVEAQRVVRPIAAVAITQEPVTITQGPVTAGSEALVTAGSEAALVVERCRRPSADFVDDRDGGGVLQPVGRRGTGSSVAALVE